MTNKEYHAEKEHISSSLVKAMAKSKKSYMKALEGFEATENMNLGTAIHTAFLEPSKFDDEIIIATKIDRRTKAGKEEYQNFLNESEGKLVLTGQQGEHLGNMIESLKDSAITPEFTDIIEESYFGEINSIKTKCRPDLLRPLDDGTYHLIDLKSCANIFSFERDFFSYKYDLQFAFYIETLASCGIEVSEASIIAIENNGLYHNQVFNIDMAIMTPALRKVIDALEDIKNIDLIPNNLPNKAIQLPTWY